MALLAEELVEEWLNRQGYFTIRGLTIGNAEMDLLAIRLNARTVERRHIEVQASNNPVSYISPLPKALQHTTGMGPFSAKKRTASEMHASVKGWLDKKFGCNEKHAVRQRLAPGDWSWELVVNVVKHTEELKAIMDAGVRVHLLPTIAQSLMKPKRKGDFTAVGSDLVGLLTTPGLLPASSP